jgi:hypothetical protein
VYIRRNKSIRVTVWVEQTKPKKKDAYIWKFKQKNKIKQKEADVEKSKPLNRRKLLSKNIYKNISATENPHDENYCI